MKITKQFRFEAAHRLPYHDGRCRREHGHSYLLELTFEGPVRAVDPNDPQSGFVVDFGRIKQIVQPELIDRYLDHHDLNQTVPEIPYTSAEHLAAWIVGWCMRHVDGQPGIGAARVHSARLWETISALAEADRNDAIALGYAPPTP
ncbi:6-pyruvoyl trahydropterin synthase family protein [Magnetofaba australis]|uniref:6-carboxy-5,6,7,8-tetrahydropterin synthase n=1 Tax=Magnetofaba australis IT-1 TaxID=1434232 RepID=A0A1Y2K5D4_9PROT|nr:6-carboxytetrahydropterin synthase [Magnetofaba australis]OSM02324.1 putative 6-pyruvoyl-tetrahydropterin synthase [Magnetofaba australis IT-1]